MKKKLRKKLKTTLCLILAIVCSFSCFVISASASTTTTTGTSTISPSNDELKAAKSPTYSASSEVISGSISQSYEMDIYHYEAPVEGYYAIYTTGSLDTVGAVYEHQNVLWWTTSYDLVANNDDGCTIDNYRNCSMVVHMAKGEDFYICVRAYASATGNYNLIIEPNEDKIISTTGGSWNHKELDHASKNLGVWVNEKHYLNKEQALLFYLLSNEDMTTNIILEDGSKLSFSMLEETYKMDPQKALNIANAAISIALCFSKPYVSLPITVLQLIIGAISSYNGEQRLCTIINEKCHITCELYPNGSELSGRFTIENGLLKEVWWLEDGNYDYYYANNDTLLTGDKYCYGIWE